jgi:HlyD family secretion protein
MKPRKARYVAAALVIVFLVGVGLWKYLAGREQSPEGTIAGNGVVEATEVDVSSKVAGRVISLRVHEGDTVERGQLIALLDSEELAGQVEQARGNLAAAEAALAELLAGTRKEDIRRAQAQYEAARRTLVQAQARLDLVRAGPRKEEIEQLRAAYEQARARLSLVREGTRPEQIRQLRAALSQAEVTLADAQTELRRLEALESQGAVAGQQVDLARTRRDVAQAQVEAARQRLAEAETGARPQEIREVEESVKAAQQRLAEAEAGARPEELREAEAAAANASSQMQAARAALDLALAGPRKETIASARARVEQARGTLGTAQASWEQTRIWSPADARVILRNVEPGELVTPGLPIIRVAMLRRVWLRVYVPEPQVGLVKLGQRAEVTVDAYPGKRYPGRVTEIAQEPEFTPKNVQTKEERVKLVFGVKVEVENQRQELKPGMPADAVIYVGARRARP